MASVIKAGNATDGVQVTSDNTGILELKTGTGSGTTAMTVGTGQAVTFAQAANLPNTFGFKNRIINGNMVIDQRNAGASVTNGFAVDRFEFQENGAAAFTIQRSTVAPAGFVNSMLVTVTTAGSATAAQVNRFFQRIEGSNIADLGFGTANASTVTLSFWVRSSLTGTYCAALVNNAANRAYVAEYSISAANTWEYKTITIAGDTTGTWETGTSSGVQVTFDLGSGSDYNATAGSWVAANDWRTTNQVNFANTNGATFYITGVQLEKGSTATSFDYRPYGTELQLCQRYYEKSYDITTVPGTNTSNGHVVGSVGAQTYGRAGTAFKVTKRAVPTMAFWSDGGVSGQANFWNGGTTGTLSVGNTVVGESGVETEIQGGTWGSRAYFYYHWTASIEL